MNFWFTTQWPPRVDEPQDNLPTGVWIPDQKLAVADGMNKGDLVFIYQSRGGPTRIVKYIDGTERHVASRQGRQGVIALCEITGKPYQPDFAKPERYSNGAEKWWRYCALVKGINSAGFIPRRRVCQFFGFSEDYNFRGYGKANSGINKVDPQTFALMMKEFIASSEATAQQLANDVHYPGFGVGGEGPVHRALKERIAQDPANVLNEPGLVLWHLEYLLPTNDKVDLVLKDRYGRFVAVEVEVDCLDTEIIGPMQCMKYRAMMAYLFKHRIDEVRSILVAHSITPFIRQQCDQFQIETLIIER